jgi:hypothetical protein
MASAAIRFRELKGQQTEPLWHISTPRSIRRQAPPGTSRPSTSGCISDCGTKIISNAPPTYFKSVAHFETFNSGRECLNIDFRSPQGFNCDAIYFGFANVTTDFDMDMSSLQVSFEDFVTMKNNVCKRVYLLAASSFPPTSRRFSSSPCTTSKTPPYRYAKITQRVKLLREARV